MPTIEKIEDINVWQEARQMHKCCLPIIQKLQKYHEFRLIDQVRGSTGSIMDNIAEGFERGNNKEFINFLGYAKGSNGEFRSQLYRIFDAGYITEEEFNQLFSQCVKIGSMLIKFIEFLLQTEIRGQRHNNKLKDPSVEYGINASINYKIEFDQV